MPTTTSFSSSATNSVVESESSKSSTSATLSDGALDDSCAKRDVEAVDEGVGGHLSFFDGNRHYSPLHTGRRRSS